MIITPIASSSAAATQDWSAGRRGNRTIGDRLRLTAEVNMTASFGAPMLIDGTISEIFWRGGVSGGGSGDPIGLEFDLRRGSSSVTTFILDCPSTANGQIVSLSSPLAVQAGDTLTLRLASASTGTATNASNPYVAGRVE